MVHYFHANNKDELELMGTKLLNASYLISKIDDEWRIFIIIKAVYDLPKQ